MDVMPPSLTLGDGRSAPQGTDLPRAVGENDDSGTLGFF